MLAAAFVGLDVETTGLDPRVDRLRLVQVAIPERTYVIDAFAVDVQPLRPLLESGPVLILQNGKFDLGFLCQAGLPIPHGDRLFDVMLGSQLLNAGLASPKGTHSLAGIVGRYLGLTLNKTEQTSDWTGPLRKEQVEYAARDASVLLPLYQALTAALAAARLSRVATIEMRALPAIVWLCMSGAPISVSDWLELARAIASEKEQLAAQLTAVAGRALNWNSGPQKKRLLQERGHDIAGTSKSVLKTIEGADPLVPLLLQYSALATLTSTYGADYVERYADPVARRIHGEFQQLGAEATGRMACWDPNLQQIPRDPRYRACFRPEPGRVLVDADYSQIELRIAAFISRDEAMLTEYREGADLHVRTAAAVLGIAEHEVTKEQRQLAKALNFGLIYGIGALRLREHAASKYGVHLTHEEAVRFRNRFFQAYPGLRRWQHRQGNGFAVVTSWHDLLARGAKVGSETRTLAGRRRLEVEKYTEKLNSPVQGSGADILKLALARLVEDRAAFPSACLVLVVHDEIVIECDAANAEGVKAWLKGHMEAAGAELLTDVPVVVDVTIAADWSGKEVD
jgi:DNA polymerase I